MYCSSHGLACSVQGADPLPLIYVAGIVGAIGLIFAIGQWVGGVNEHRKTINQTLSDFMAEIRTDIKDILTGCRAGPWPREVRST